MRVVFFLWALGFFAMPLWAELTPAESLREGVRLLQEKKYDEGVALLERARDHAPNAAEIYNLLGVAYLHMEKLDQAQVSFEKAIQLKPDYAEAYFNLGATYAQYRQDPLSAKDYFEKTIVLDPTHAAAYHALGLVFLTGDNDPQRALDLFEKAVTLDPDMTAAYFGLGMVYVMTGKSEQALGPISQLRRLNHELYAVALESLLRGDGQFASQRTASQSLPDPAVGADSATLYEPSDDVRDRF